MLTSQSTDWRLAVSHPVIDLWLKSVNAHSVDKVCGLYAPDAILLPTLSDIICDSPEDIRNYFESFLGRPKLKATLTNCYVQEYSEVKIDSGIYRFEWEDAQLKKICSTSARFTFVVRDRHIVEHHSSMTPGEHH